MLLAQAPGFDIQGFRKMGCPVETIIHRLEELAAHCEFLTSSAIPLPRSAARLPRFCFDGPNGGGDPIKIGIFAGIHGDEPAGPEASIRLFEFLAANPEFAEGYQLVLYPVCNPYGLKRGIRFSESGKDLNREFWRDSSEPEVMALEQEILHHTFHGFVSLHTDDTSDGLYGFVRGSVLAKSLLEPALAAAERTIPRNLNPVIDGFPAQTGIISQCYDGILTAPPKLEGSPFEIILETPHIAPLHKQADALNIALQAILTEYRKFISFAADL